MEANATNVGDPIPSRSPSRSASGSTRQSREGAGRPPVPPGPTEQAGLEQAGPGPQKEGKGQAYFQDWAFAVKAACDYADSLVGGYHPHTQHVFKHILHCGRLGSYKGGWVPIPARLIQRKKPEADLQRLVGEGLLEMRPHDRLAGLCREYRVAPRYSARYTTISAEHISEGKWVNLYSSKPTTRTRTSALSDENNNPHPDLIREALKTIEVGFFNERAVQAHISRRKEEWLKAKKDLKRVQEEEEVPQAALEKANRLEKKRRRQFEHDAACYEAMKSQQIEKQGDVVKYQMAYDVQMSGRIGQIGGGAQSASREMKTAIYQGLGIRNYDIKSSQAFILRDLLREAGIDASWIEEYLSTDRAKHKYAERAGLTTGAWKTCLYALFMGASLPDDISGSSGEIRKTLEEEVFDPESPAEDLQAACERLTSVIGDLAEALSAWHDYLVDQWLPQEAVHGRGGLRSVQNETGMRYTVPEGIGRWYLQRKLAAFRLQGREAAFIHTLTTLSDSYGYTVISNEHDGLVVLGRIPEEAIEEARQKVDMPYVQLPEKDFL